MDLNGRDRDKKRGEKPKLALREPRLREGSKG